MGSFVGAEVDPVAGRGKAAILVSEPVLRVLFGRGTAALPPVPPKYLSFDCTQPMLVGAIGMG